MYRPAPPSFSSSLLDEIYRSIDEQPTDDHDTTTHVTEKHPNYGYFRNHHDPPDDVHPQLSCIFQVRSSPVDFKNTSRRTVNSSSSSSDSSSAGGFSSSEAESVYGRPKPIRTRTNQYDEYNTRSKQMNMYRQTYQFQHLQSKQKHETRFVKTKSRATKIYGDLKKVKQPNSPGGLLATFLNSLFTTGNEKNTKFSSSSVGSYGDGRQSKSAGGSTCSSASSFSRSCLSKTPSSSRGNFSNNKKRSVKFLPVNVIVDDDCQPYGHKSLYEHESNLHALKFVKNHKDEFRVHLNEKSRRIEEAARNLLRNYQKKVECEYDLNNMIAVDNLKDETEMELNYEEEDDAASNTSSDLFELVNFSAIGMDDELPVYETTHLDTNLTIGNGFRM